MERVIVKPPRLCSVSELDSFCDMVIMGGEIRSSNLMKSVTHAITLGFCYSDGILVSTSAIKQPNESYKERNFNKAKIGELANNYIFELGYSFTLPEYRRRGHNFKLKQRLLLQIEVSNKVYCTISVNNRDSIGVVKKLGFVERGLPYIGLSGRKIQIFTRG